MIFVVLGVSGSGKSTIGVGLADRFQLPFFDADNYHSDVNKAKMAGGTPLDDDDRQPWLETLAKLLGDHESSGGAVLACSSLKNAYRSILESQLKNKAEFIYLRGSFETIYERLKQRSEHFMNPDLLKSQFETLEEPADAFVVDIEEPVEDIIQAVEVKYRGRNQA